MKNSTRSNVLALVMAISIASPVLAHAQEHLRLSCKVDQIKAQAGSIQNSPVLFVTLQCDPNALDGRTALNGSPQAQEWFPAVEQSTLSQLQTSQKSVELVTNSTYFGVVESLNGRAMSEINPLAARNRFVAVIGEDGSALTQEVAKVLDAKQVPFTARHACNPRSAASPCFDVKDRSLKIEQLKGNFFELSMDQIGGFYSYGTWTKAYTRVSINGLSDAAHGDLITLNAADSAKVRSIFSLGGRTSFTSTNSQGKPVGITIDDDGQVIRIKATGTI